VRCGLDDIPVIQGRPLSTVAGILAHTRLFIGHDSGLTHLSAAVLVPTVAVFGPTDPRQWAPRGRHVGVVTGLPCTCHGWERVRACEAKPCLSILPETIVAASLSLLDRYRTVTKS
jgi:ADP-heptose:LPS heptosyltransferase